MAALPVECQSRCVQMAPAGGEAGVAFENWLEGEGEAYLIATSFTAAEVADWGIRRDFCTVQGRC